MYEGEIIQFSGGIREYMGELDQTEHPLGKTWYRLKNPCVLVQRNNPQKNSVENVIAAIWGHNKAYRKFIDIRVPEESILEIRVLDKNGEFYKVYKQEVERIQQGRIITPDFSAVPPNMN